MYVIVHYNRVVAMYYCYQLRSQLQILMHAHKYVRTYVTILYCDYTINIVTHHYICRSTFFYS